VALTILMFVIIFESRESLVNIIICSVYATFFAQFRSRLDLNRSPFTFEPFPLHVTKSQKKVIGLIDSKALDLAVGRKHRQRV
jgi:hypothetical protein